jgi:hypothetical protein
VPGYPFSEPQVRSVENIPSNLEMYPTQAKKRLEWATNHFHALRLAVGPGALYAR